MLTSNITVVQININNLILLQNNEHFNRNDQFCFAANFVNEKKTTIGKKERL